ncbi:hypothetical protein PUNSTDRAFT_139414 [Punctularia strigosozonata HHB-11173 SS5]|uniref:Uncharacterized protein n=1 Tax=Punctularia strigosozonata (strain HHB-11173) TaxID=741275 RepID=R7RZI6_PUNST|nr:uncharacterized protein PUNSTDRAFT_139414 [Punctularia strigosozonata HHB-11173 SS5]EIN03530.1 hypothetical protein PUNSTDRAFT_139414 [Punctularia strigosozonata HHB-11173 SS5]
MNQKFYSLDERCMGCVIHRQSLCVRFTAKPDENRPCRSCMGHDMICVPSRPTRVPTTAEEWAEFMADQVAIWGNRLDAMGEELERSVERTHSRMAATIGESVVAMTEESARAQLHVKKYALSSASEIKDMKNQMRELVVAGDKDGSVVEKACRMVEEFDDKLRAIVPMVNKQSEAVSNLCEDVEATTRALDRRITFYVDKLREVARRVQVDFSDPPPVFGTDPNDPSHSPIRPVARADDIAAPEPHSPLVDAEGSDEGVGAMEEN